MSTLLGQPVTQVRFVRYDDLYEFTKLAFHKAGLSQHDAKTGADVLVTTDAWGVYTHGTKLLRNYLRRLKTGGLRAGGKASVAKEGPAWAIVDGDSSLGVVTSVYAMQTAITKAKACGVSYVGVRNSCHFGAAGYYTWLAAREGLIGLSMANDTPSVACPGSRKGITGSNPISYAVPAGKYPPMFLDMSVATVAGGKVYAARTRGESIPPTWLVGPDGKPTTDPSGYPETGALQPAAGHKGYGIALLIEALAGVLSGAAVTWQVGSWLWDDGKTPTNHGAAFLAIDCAAMMPKDQFARRMESLIEEICSVPVSTPGEVEAAIGSAQAAFPLWSRIPAPKRAEMLRKALESIRTREEEFARTITLENGKTLRESRVEVQAAIKEFEFQLGQGRRLGGPYLGSELPGVTCHLRREPLGVVSLITPWNFPFNVACRKLVPALVAGNCCVLKPADLTPMCAGLLFEALETAGLPNAVANLVYGRGSVIGDTLVGHPAIKAISFTGSTEVGVGIEKKVSGRGTRIQLEMGGKNPLVVMADADLEAAAEAIILGAFSCAGQWCTSTSRAIVEESVYDKVLDLVLAKAKTLKVGDGFDENVRVGPVCGPQQFETILRYIDIGRKEGARLCCGGAALTDGALRKGYFIAPTIFADVRREMRIAREEIFGPVLSVMKFTNFEEALALANGVVFGLSSSIYTRDLANAQRFVAESCVGLCHVNMPTAYKEPQLEFGGIKESGRGIAEAGESGIEFFTHHKAVYMREQA